jgi:hypothetical protein
MSFDEQPDGDPHGECAAHIHNLESLLAWAYGKLTYRSFDNMDDALKMDEIKLIFMQKAAPQAGPADKETGQ